jgi:hypothetical protein
MSDDFDAGVLSDAWTSGGGCDTHAGPPGGAANNTVTVVGGRVWAYENCNYIETTHRFVPPLRIEAEIGSDHRRGDWYPCWNHYFELYLGPSDYGPAGVVLFDRAGRDVIGLGPGCAEPAGYSLPEAGPNHGVATLTVNSATVFFKFVNADAGTIETDLRPFPGPAPREPRPVRLWLAGPSYVDSVRIYGLP